jgi:hypothetical protein
MIECAVCKKENSEYRSIECKECSRMVCLLTECSVATAMEIICKECNEHHEN